MIETKQLKDNIYLFTMKSGNIEAALTNYGASIFSIIAPDRNGTMDDVMLTCDNIEDFQKNTMFMGAVVGRVANRIPFGRFALNGKEYTLGLNEGKNHLHGGFSGFDKKTWNYKVCENKVVFTLLSKDGEEGYPGNLLVSASYSLEGDALLLEYAAVCDQDTIINLTNHTHFNMGGHKSGSIRNHTLRVNGGFYLETNSDLQSTGQILSVKDTPLDFSECHTIGERIDEPHAMLVNAGGYDLSYLRDITDDFAAEYADPISGRCLTVSTTLPCVHLYTCNMNDNEKGKDGAIYQKQDAVCFETQFLPDAVNHWYYGPTVLKAGERMYYYTKYAFGIK